MVTRRFYFAQETLPFTHGTLPHDRRRSTRHPSNAGFVLSLVLLMVTTMLTLTAVTLTRSTTEMSVTNRFVGSQQAFSQAEAGIDEALAEFAVGGGNFLPTEGWDDNPGNGNGVCEAGELCTKLILNNPNSTVTVNDITAAQPTVTANSLVNGKQQQVTVVLAKPKGGWGQYGVFGGDALYLGKVGASTTLRGVIVVDSYDRRNGPYNDLLPPSADDHDDALIGTNDNGDDATEDLILSYATAPASHKVEVYGKASVTNWTELPGEGTNPEFIQYPQATLSTSTPGPNPRRHDPAVTLPTIEVPPELSALCGNAKVLKTSATITTDMCYTKIAIGDGHTVTLEPGVRLYLLGDGNATLPTVLSIQGTGQLVVKGNNQLFGGAGMLLLTGDKGIVHEAQVDMDPGNDTSPHPKDLVIRITGNPTKSHLIQQGTPFYGAVYLNRGRVELKGQSMAGGVWYKDATFHGSLMNNSHVEIVSQDEGQVVRVRQDLSLRDEAITLSGGAGSGGSSQWTILSWQSGE